MTMFWRLINACIGLAVLATCAQAQACPAGENLISCMECGNETVSLCEAGQETVACAAGTTRCLASTLRRTDNNMDIWHYKGCDDADKCGSGGACSPFMNNLEKCPMCADTASVANDAVCRHPSCDTCSCFAVDFNNYATSAIVMDLRPAGTFAQFTATDILKDSGESISTGNTMTVRIRPTPGTTLCFRRITLQVKCYWKVRFTITNPAGVQELDIEKTASLDFDPIEYISDECLEVSSVLVKIWKRNEALCNDEFTAKDFEYFSCSSF